MTGSGDGYHSCWTIPVADPLENGLRYISNLTGTKHRSGHDAFATDPETLLRGVYQFPEKSPMESSNIDLRRARKL